MENDFRLLKQRILYLELLNSPLHGLLLNQLAFSISFTD